MITYAVTEDDLAICAECLHIRYHHRPACFSWLRDIGEPLCHCRGFVEPKKERYQR